MSKGSGDLGWQEYTCPELRQQLQKVVPFQCHNCVSEFYLQFTVHEKSAVSLKVVCQTIELHFFQDRWIAAPEGRI